MAIDGAEDFLAVLDKSKLLSGEQLADARLAAENSDDPKTIAKTLIRQELLTRWQAGQLLAGRSSFFLGKYKLIELLGRGGMGSVFLARHTMMNRRVALKILPRQVGKDPASLERFLSEARAIAALDHPNIVQAFSVDHEEDRYFIVMEYVDGRDLQQIVEAEGPLDFDLIADWIAQAADGLAHGHQRNIIHCDVKPSNLLVNDRGVVKIVDMGLARLTRRDQQNADSQEDCVLGTVDYLAPEQALESADFDHRADIYALGCTLYFLLTGRPPFAEGSLHERLMKHQTQSPPDVLQQRGDAPRGLVELCRRMMAKQADDRPQSAQEVNKLLADRYRPQQTVALKTAEPLEGKVPADSLSIQVAVAAKGAAKAGREEDSPEELSYFRTPQQKILAAVIGGLAVVVLVATMFFAGSGSRPQSKDPAPVRTRQQEIEPEIPLAREPPPAEAEEPSTDFPMPGLLASDPPPADAPPSREPGPEIAEAPPAADPQPQPEPQKEPQPEPKPAEPEKKTDPLKELAAAVDLPPWEATGAAEEPSSEPISLGKLYVEDGLAWDLELKGGKPARKGSRQFILERNQENTSWGVYLQRPAKPPTESQRDEVARIWLDEQSLRFQWSKDAPPGRSEKLRGCGLLVRVGDKSRWLPLTRPKPVEPLTLDLEKERTTVMFPTESWIPRHGALKMQVTGFDGPFPKHEFKGADGISEKGKVEVALTGPGLPPIKLRVAMSVRARNVKVEATASYQSVDRRWYPWKLNGLNQQSTLMDMEFHRRKSFTDTLAPNDPRLAVLGPQRDAAGAAAAQLKALSNLQNQLHNTGKIRFRVFARIDDQQITFFETSAMPAEN